MSNFPYDAGNAGDLIKHEWLLRSLDWILPRGTYLDAFAGVPNRRLVPKVADRLLAAPAELRLRGVQKDTMAQGYYLGSTELARRHKSDPQVMVFEEDPIKKAELEKAGFAILELPGGSGYNALRSENLAAMPPIQLALVDPYNVIEKPDERELAPETFCKDMGQFPGAVLFFVPDRNPGSHYGIVYRKRLACLSLRRPVLRAIVPPLLNSGIRGEDSCFAELLYLPEPDAAWFDVERRIVSLRTGARAVATTLGLHFESRTRPAYEYDRVEFIRPL
ncbi:MAG TPA: hypothetical protein VM054_01250 [bacterium]|nr:hypothetical protein [bacterium]